MAEHTLTRLASIVVLGIGAQWLAWRLKLPSILFLLVLGFMAGPVSGFLHPDALLGDLLFPVVSVSVAVILFEGGLTLKLPELRGIGGVVLKLVSLGVLVTWLLLSATAYLLLGLNLELAILLGAILVVTGPTVIGPMLRHIRPTAKVGNVLKWEGIVIDPIGALLAVLVFEAVVVGETQRAGVLVVTSLLKTIFIGGSVGLLTAATLVLLLKRYWIPDFLQETVTLMLVIVAFVVSNHFQSESGLFSVILMGMALDNQRAVTVKHILKFGENLRVLIISSLFILLAARLRLPDLAGIAGASLILLAMTIFLARPAAVFLATVGSDLSRQERLFIGFLAPRGIVAAAVASIFALRLSREGVPQAEVLVPLTFAVIVGTVTVYGLIAPTIARRLKVAQSDPQGALIIGAHSWARAIAEALRQNNFAVVMVDTNRNNVRTARLQGIQAYYGSAISEHIVETLDLHGIGRLLALTPNDEANSLAVLNFSDLFETAELYQLPPEGNEAREEEAFSAQHLRGRFLFGPGMDFNYLSQRFAAGATLKTTRLSEEFTFEHFRDLYGEVAVPLFLITAEEKLVVATIAEPLEPGPGQTLIALVDEEEA